MMRVFGRLKPDVTLDRRAPTWRPSPAGWRRSIRHRTPTRPATASAPFALREELTHERGRCFWTLLGAAAFVLLIACANVANLILARMARREQELTIRTAMGAGSRPAAAPVADREPAAGAARRRRSAWHSPYGSMGLLTSSPVNSRRAPAKSRWTAGCSVSLSCAPPSPRCCAVRWPRFTPAASGRGPQGQGGASRTARQPQLVRSALIAAQVAFSYVLLIGAGLMVNSLIQLQRVNPGLRPAASLRRGLDLNFTKYPDAQSQRMAARRLLERIQPLPGVLRLRCLQLPHGRRQRRGRPSRCASAPSATTVRIPRCRRCNRSAG